MRNTHKFRNTFLFKIFISSTSKGENMTHLQKFMQTKKLIIDAKINACFKDYKCFICCDDLPNFKIQYTDSREDASVNYEAQILLYRTPIILKINIALLDEKSEKFKLTLVHEFTHLYDYYSLKKNCSDDFLKKNLALYSEFHASQIEIIYCYNVVNKITETIDFSKIDDNILTKIPFERLEMFNIYALDYYNNQTIENFYIMKITYMYLQGAIALLNKATNKKIELTNFLSPSKDVIKEIVKLLSKIEYNELPSIEILEKIGNLDLQIKMY